MNRKELVLTVAGLIATYCLPWPAAEVAPGATRMALHAEQAAIERTAPTLPRIER